MVFISYSRKDKDFVEPLVKLLRASGQDVFFDKDNIIYGSKWLTALENAINNSKRFLLFWSKSAQNSEVVKTEIALALTHTSLVIVPIILDKSPLPKGVSEFNGSEDLIQLFKEIITHKRRNKRVFKLLIASLIVLIFIIGFFLIRAYPIPSGYENYYDDHADINFALLTGLLLISAIWLLLSYIWKRAQIIKKYKIATTYLLK